MVHRSIAPKAAQTAVTVIGLLLSVQQTSAAESAPPLIVVNKAAAQVEVGKAISYRQTAEGKLNLLQYDFMGEFIPSSKEIKGVAELVTPKGEVIPFGLPGSGLIGEGLRHFDTLDALNARVPNGRYTVRYTRPDLAAFTAQLDVNATMATMPAPFRIRLMQNGHAISPSSIDPARALIIQAIPSAKGKIDDMIFVHIADCSARPIARTPPFAGSPELAHRGLSYSVPENTFVSGMVYQIYVEGGTQVMNRVEGVPVFALNPVTTFLDFKTTGDADASCPATPYQMDARESDRKHAP